MDNNILGNRIKSLRTKHHYSLSQLCKKLNFDPSNLSKIENGKRKPPLDLLEQMAELFEVEMSYFFIDTVPKELKERNVKWINFGEDMEKRNLTPEQIKKIVDMLDAIRKE